MGYASSGEVWNCEGEREIRSRDFQIFLGILWPPAKANPITQNWNTWLAMPKTDNMSAITVVIASDQNLRLRFCW